MTVRTLARGGVITPSRIQHSSGFEGWEGVVEEPGLEEVMEIAAGISSFRGVKRRCEVRGVEAGVTVLDDFAHHPTAVATTSSVTRAGS